MILQKEMIERPKKKQTLNKNTSGLDRVKLKLIFIDKCKIPQRLHLINLQDILVCQLLKTRNLMNGHINNISLRCSFKEKNKPDILLPFYDEANDKLYKMMRLLKKASYWKKSITLFREVSANHATLKIVNYKEISGLKTTGLN